MAINNVVEIDTRDLSVTPFFTVLMLENVQKSEAEGHLVKEAVEVVQVRVAGSTIFSPVFPTNAFWKREGNRTITYAERWPDEYRKFKEGEPQEARGTPLEMLAVYGITPEHQSICRALRIYSIEQLHGLEGPNLKNLGIQANSLKEAARKFMADRMSGSEATARIAELEAKIAALMERSTIVPETDTTPAEAAAALEAADAYEGLSDAALLALLVKRTGKKVPPGANPTREQVTSMLLALDSEAAA